MPTRFFDENSWEDISLSRESRRLIGVDLGVDEGTVRTVLQDRLSQRGWVSPQVRIERGFLENYVHIRVMAQATLHCEVSISDEALVASRNQHSLLENTLRQVVNAFPDISERHRAQLAEEHQELMELRHLRELVAQKNWAQGFVDKTFSYDPWFVVPTPPSSRWEKIVKGDVLPEDD